MWKSILLLNLFHQLDAAGGRHHVLDRSTEDPGCSDAQARAPRSMLDFESDPTLRRLLRIARLRVTVGFIVAGVGFWFATPTWTSLGVGALVATVGEAVRVWAAGHLKKEQEAA